LRVQPPVPSSFLPPQPLSERGRRPWPRRIARAVVVAGVGLAVAVPLAFAALGPGGPFGSLGGGVAGAVSASLAPVATPPPAATSAPTAAPPATQPGSSGPEAPPVVVIPTAPAVASLTGYQWPINVGRISLPFKAIPGGEWFNGRKLWHDGVDMASFCGARVNAAHDGVVLAASRHFDQQIGWIGDLQPYFHLLDVRHMWNDLPIVVVIDDGNGYRSIYAHFRDVNVRVGQHVKAGQQIGHEGATGHASGCHVHYGLFSPFETKQFGVRADILRRLRLPKQVIARVDPLAVLPGGEVALRTRQIAKAIAAANAAAAAAAGGPISVGPMPVR